jgi:MFS family permease
VKSNWLHDAGNMSRSRRRLKELVGAFGAVWSNKRLRRVEFAYASSVASETAYLVALGVFAYEVGGALAVGVVGLIRMFPAALATPFAALLGDRYSRERVLLFVALGSAITLASSAVVFYLGPLEALIYGLSAFHAAVSTLLRPALAALVPSLATTPKELVAANGVSMALEGVGTLIGPIVGGVLVAIASPGIAFAFGAAAYLLAMLLLAQVQVPGGLVLTAPPDAHRTRDALVAGLRAVVTDPNPRIIVALVCAQSLVRGALNVLVVVVTFRLLGVDSAWVGYLIGAIGVGGLLGALVSPALAGRRLALPFGVGLILWGLPIALIPVWPNPAVALALLAVVGFGNSIEDVSAYTLLQRMVPDELLTRVFGVLFAVAVVGLGVGSIAAPALVAAVGVRGALIATGSFLIVATLLAWRRLVAIDAVVLPPSRELSLLSAVPLFEPLSVAAKEHLASRLGARSVSAGATIVSEGDPGDYFYIVIEGHADVTIQGASVRRQGPGDSFGEIALLRDVRRTATVTAREQMELCTIRREDFLAVVTGHPAVRKAGEAVVRERLATRGASSEPRISPKSTAPDFPEHPLREHDDGPQRT